MLKNSKMGKGFSGMLGNAFRNVPLHPNTITYFSVVFALLGYAAYDYNGWYALCLFALAFFVDALDGAVARAKNMSSAKGAFIDGVCDRLVEFFIILVLFKTADFTLVLEKDSWLLIVLFFGTGMTSFVKAYAEHAGVMKHEEAVKMPGMLERAERSILLVVALILALLQNEYAAAVIMFTATLSFLTFVQRFARALGSE